MGFFHKHLKKPLKSSGLLLPLLSCLSCQSLDTQHLSLNRHNNACKKNVDLKKPSLHDETSACSPVIDNNHFEIQADSSYLKGMTALFDKNNTNALNHFKTALLFSPNSLHLKKQLAETYEKEGLLAEAFNHYRALSKNTENNKKFLKKITQIYSLRGLHQQALKNHQFLLKQDPDNASLWLKQALLLTDQENWTEALKTLNQAEIKASNPKEKVQIILSQSYVFTKLKNPQKSLMIMNKLANLQIHTESFALKIAEFYKFLKQPSLATEYLERFQKTQGITKLVSKKLLDYYIDSSKWEKAFQQIEQIQKSGYFENHHYFYTAMLFIEKQNYDRALVFLKDLVAKEPKDGQYLYFLAFAHEQKKEWFKSISVYNQVPKTSPLFLAAKLQVTQVLKKTGQQKKSLNLLKKLSFSERGMSLQALLFYAEDLWDAGYKKKAIHVLTKGLGYKPSHADLLLLRAFYFKESGQLNSALRDIKEILKKEKDHGEALNFIAAIYSEQQINLNNAEKMAKKALLIKPESSYFLNTLGWIMFQNGKWQSALSYLNKAFARDNTNSHIAKRLGKVHLKLKNFKKSEYFFKEALKLEKNDKQSKFSQKTFIHKQAFMR